MRNVFISMPLRSSPVNKGVSNFAPVSIISTLTSSALPVGTGSLVSSGFFSSGWGSSGFFSSTCGSSGFVSSCFGSSCFGSSCAGSSGLVSSGFCFSTNKMRNLRLYSSYFFSFGSIISQICRFVLSRLFLMLMINMLLFFWFRLGFPSADLFYVVVVCYSLCSTAGLLKWSLASFGRWV